MRIILIVKSLLTNLKKIANFKFWIEFIYPKVETKENYKIEKCFPFLQNCSNQRC